MNREDTLAALMHEYRDWYRRSKELETEGDRLKRMIGEALGNDNAAVMGVVDGKRYVAEWRSRNNQKLDMAKLTAIAWEKGLRGDYYDRVLREEAVADLVKDKLLAKEDLQAALTGTISRYVQVVPHKETEETA